MATTSRRFTFDDLELIPQEHEGDRHELIDGELIVTPSPMPRHQFVSENISNVLGQFVREWNLGRIA
jgi:Uma2 family endonuclease